MGVGVWPCGLNVTAVRLINDLEATSYALTELTPGDVVTLSAAKKDVNGNKATVAPGSGLGESFLTWDGAKYASFASEGGHGDFAPNIVRFSVICSGIYKKIIPERFSPKGSNA
ncbi:MAG: glucokinase [Thermodesulfobacteriota bacterium]|nr:glucokinase [Thermodesulfobacteriota bacterium]